MEPLLPPVAAGDASDGSEFVMIEGAAESPMSDGSDNFQSWNTSRERLSPMIPSNTVLVIPSSSSAGRPPASHRDSQIQARRQNQRVEDADELDSLVFPSSYLLSGTFTPPHSRPSSRPGSPGLPPSYTSKPPSPAPATFSPKIRASSSARPATPPNTSSMPTQDVFRSRHETIIDQALESGAAAISEAFTISFQFTIKFIDWISTRNPSQFWLAAYFFASISLTISNKYLLRGWFPFPWILTTVQLSFAMVGTQISAKLGLYRVARLSPQRELIIYSAATLFSCEILLSNVSLKMVTLPYHLSVRALSPLVVLFVRVLYFHQITTLRTTSTLLVILFGVIFTSIGLDLDSLGSLLAISSMLLLSTKTLITQHLLFDRYKLHPLDLLARVAPLGMAHSAIFAVVNGELGRMWSLPKEGVTRKYVIILLANGAVSYVFVVLGLVVDKRTRAPAPAICAHAAQAVTIAVSAILFKLSLTATNFFGVVLTLGGGILYARTEALETERISQTPMLLSGQLDNGKGKILPD